jgi:hypothetical protein
MNAPMIVGFDLHIELGPRGRKSLRDTPPLPPAPARTPRVTKLLALAHRLERLVRSGGLANYAQIAAVGHVTRARMSQIMSLLNLAPDIQEAILCLPPVERGRDPIILADLRPIASELDWRRQRRLWALLRRERAISR